jgi:hypothetical protein
MIHLATKNDAVACRGSLFQRIKVGVLRLGGHVVGVALWVAAKKCTVEGKPVLVLAGADDVVLADIRDRMGAALRLVREGSPTVFKRMEQNVDRFAITERHGPKYWHQFRVCVFSLGQVLEWQPSQLASLVVHEVTHATIRARGINPREDVTMVRKAERMCVRAQLRFARRLGPDAGPMIRWLEQRLESY